MKRLPSLLALRAFEAAARHGSFTKAAEELHVTQGAISRHVRALEEELRTSLFSRAHRRVELTAQGARLLPPLREGFERMAAAVEAVRAGRAGLRVKALPTFSMRLLIPRLAGLRSACPDLDLHLVTSLHEADLDREDLDGAIIYRRHDEPGAGDEVVLDERCVLVAAPSYLADAPPLRCPADVARHRLLLNSPDAWDWRSWAEIAGVRDLPLERGLVFDLDEPAIIAACAGHGVALVASAFVERELRLGQLVLPLPGHRVRLGHYHLARAPRARGDVRLDRLAAWLCSELAEANRAHLDVPRPTSGK